MLQGLGIPFDLRRRSSDASDTSGHQTMPAERGSARRHRAWSDVDLVMV
jgi:hypothetical protein